MNDHDMLNSELVMRLREIGSVLNSNGMEFALVGGLAVAVWGDARSTYDVDFVVASGASDLTRLRQWIESSHVRLASA